MMSVSKLLTWLTMAVTLLAGSAQAAGCDTRITLQLYSGYPSKGKAAQAPDVKVLQSYIKITADGLFGPNTEKAVKAYQTSQQLTADGIVGPETWAKLCGSPATTPTPTGGTCGSLSNPYGTAPKGTTVKLNPITQFVQDKIYSCIPGRGIKCSTYLSGGSSDHPGNAMDCFVGGGCVYSGTDKEDGDVLAAWAVKNYKDLKINYVIWQDEIWSRSNPSWRSQGKTGKGTCTYAHYDHVHISVITG